MLALCLASWPITMFSQQVRDIAPVAFIRFRRGPHVVGSAFLSSANLIAAVTLPTCVLISTLAAPIVHLIYGPVWAPAAPVLAWLAPLATLRVFYVLANDYFAVLAPTRRTPDLPADVARLAGPGPGGRGTVGWHPRGGGRPGRHRGPVPAALVGH